MGRRNFKHDTGQRSKRNRSKNKSFKSPKQFEKEAANTNQISGAFGFVSSKKKPRQQPTDIAIEMFGSTYVDYDVYIKG
jgi:hypothetical protein